MYEPQWLKNVDAGLFTRRQLSPKEETGIFVGGVCNRLQFDINARCPI